MFTSIPIPFLTRLRTIKSTSCIRNRKWPIAYSSSFFTSQISLGPLNPHTSSNRVTRLLPQVFVPPTPGLLSLARPVLIRPTTSVEQNRTCQTHALTPAPEIEELFIGNKRYLGVASKDYPELLKELALKGQKPQFTIFTCSDSRVSEQAIFSARPGTFFTASNIANQFHEEDLTSNAVLSYALETLAVKHVVILGHYGCGGVAAAMLPDLESARSEGAVQKWIQPIRELYQSSTRPEIVEYRKASLAEPPHLHNPAFRALVEENVKANVQRIASTVLIKNHYDTLALDPKAGIANASCPTSTDVYVHGWVYDIENGEVSDLRVSVGPPGKTVPSSPFPLPP